MSVDWRHQPARRFASDQDQPHARRRRRMGAFVFLLGSIASGSLVGAVNYYLAEPATLALLYAIPVTLVAYRFHYPGAIVASVLAAALTFLSASLHPGTLFFDVLVLSVALVALAGMLAAKVGVDRALADSSAAEDPATGLASRRAIVGALSLELTRCARYNRPLATLMLGLDELSRATPAAVAHRMKEIGRLLESAVRDVDVVGSCGERELLVVLPETRKADALPVAERLRAAIEQMRLTLPTGGETSTLTVSLGVAAYPEDSQSVEGLLDAAGEALFEARTLGGNRVRQARKLQVVSRRS